MAFQKNHFRFNEKKIIFSRIYNFMRIKKNNIKMKNYTTRKKARNTLLNVLNIQGLLPGKQKKKRKTNFL